MIRNSPTFDDNLPKMNNKNTSTPKSNKICHQQTKYSRYNFSYEYESGNMPNYGYDMIEIQICD